ncbi:MAG TPA: hypothetical protein VMT54_20240 [Candidatus Cybelea sp.]|nr:hypothetical protein [Candidatus Cybelea sp.]
MADIAANPGVYTASVPPAAGVESRFSGVSWGAIVAGAVVAAAMAIILTTLGAGLGLVAVSPWPGEGASASTIGIGVIIWSIVIEAVAFGIGGYLAGRLRTKWANLHGDEVYFRDTAHGFVTWALGTLVGICVMTAVVGGIARTTAEVGAAGVGAAGAAGGAGALALASNSDAAGNSMAGAGMQGNQQSAGGNPMDYYIDMLFRPNNPAQAGQNGAANTNGAAGGATTGTATGTTGATPDTTQGQAGAPAMSMAMNGNGGAGQSGNDAAIRNEVARIAAASFKSGDLTLAQNDRTYIAQLVAQRTGMSQQDAEKRVDDVFGQAKSAYDDFVNKTKQAADQARKAGIGLALWTFVAMLIGAFVASWMAAVGGRLRDQ